MYSLQLGTNYIEFTFCEVAALLKINRQNIFAQKANF